MFPKFHIGSGDPLESSWLDGALLQYHQQLRDVFRLQWTAHRCDVEGCQKVLVAGKIYYDHFWSGIPVYLYRYTSIPVFLAC